MKTCGHCKKSLPLTMFNAEKRKKDGLGSWCKRCKSNGNTRRRNEKLKSDPDWMAERGLRHRLSNMVRTGVVKRPETCPCCGKPPKNSHDMHAKIVDPENLRSCVWRCRACALHESGKSETRACLWCHEPFQAQTQVIRTGGGRYCSAACRNEWMRKTAEHMQKTKRLSERSSADAVFMDDR